MKLTRRSVAMLAVAAMLVLLNVVRPAVPLADRLPELPLAIPEQIVRMQISTPIERLTIQRLSNEKGTLGFDRWSIVTPLEFPADAAQVRTVLRTFGLGLPMEAFVDEGNHEDYGVDDQNGRLLELFRAGDDVPVLAVVVGKTAAGPSTFVRIPGAPSVYRADVGGLGRYARPAAEWRDKMAIDLDPSLVVGLTLSRGGQDLAFTRGPSSGPDKEGSPLPGAWGLPGAPFPVDSATVDAVIKGLSRIRAGEIHNPDYVAGLDTPLATAALVLNDGTTRTLTLGSREEKGASFIRVDGRDEVFRVNAGIGRALREPIDTFRDRTLLEFDRSDVASVAYVDRGLTVVLAQAADGGSWTVAQPANMDADQKQVLVTVNTLSGLRAAAIPTDRRFDSSGARFEVRFRDGRTQVLELGQAERDLENRPLVRVRVGGKDGVYQLTETLVVELRKAFGRG